MENLVIGDYFEFFASGDSVRGAFLDAHHLLVEGSCAILGRSEAIGVFSQNGRTLIGSASKFDAGKITANLDAAIEKRRRWLARQTVPSFADTRMQRTVARALSVMKTQVYSPEGDIRHRWTTPDRWPHRAMWLWDSAFHAIAWRYFDPSLAREMISAVFDKQRADGFVPHMMKPDGTSNITQPPVLALGVKLVNEIAPSREWVESLYPKLGAYVRWDLANRDSDGNGLVEWFIEGNPHCRSGESGMDNSPRFDSATQLDAVDFNSFLASECEILAEFASALGLAEEIRYWRARHQKLCRLINERLWSEHEKFYVDYDVERGAASSVLASAGFLPLICGAASREQAEHLARHLRDPQMFGTALPVPSIAVKDTKHYVKDMWRGPVWININWLIARGFERYGMRDMAEELRATTMRAIEKFCDSDGTFFEFYDDRMETHPAQLMRKGKCAPEVSPYHQVFYDYGWTATLYVDMAMCQSHREREVNLAQLECNKSK